MLKKKLIGGGIACALAMNCLLTVPFGSTAAETKFEFEDGTQTGSATVLSELSGYSGTGYVFLQDNADTISVTVTAPETGMYELTIAYASIYGDKVQGLEINGVSQGNVSFPEGSSFEEIEYGTVKLNEGENTVTIVGSWGWTLFDYVTIAPAEAVTLNKCNILSDANATSEAQGLMNYMADMYGDYIVSGQQEVYGGGHSGNYEWEFDYLEDLTGELPAIRGFDFMNYNPLYGWDDGTTERVIEWVNDRGGIATASWHINVPKDFASYTLGEAVDWSNATYGTSTDFSVINVVTDSTSKDYQYFMLCVDQLAAELKQLQDAGVPLLFRPFHEAEGAGGETGSWFWWGKDGSAAYKELWKLLYTTLTEEYGLHNLVWEFNSYTYTNSINWYPGNEYVDLVGYDKYNASANNPNESAISSTFNGLVDRYNDYGKMIAMMECDTIPSIENMLSESAYWLYFCPWYEGDDDSGKFLTLFNNADTLTTIYQHEKVITLDELPDYKTYEFTGEDFIPATTEATEPTDPITAPEEGHAKVVEEENYTALIFPEAVGESFFVEVEMSDGAYANGGIGAGAMIGDTYYWANISWEANGSGVIEIDTDNFFNVTDSDGVEVTDEAIISQLAEILKTENTTFQAQVWYADADGTETALADVKFVDAWLADADQGTTDSVDPTEPSDTDEKDVVEGTVEETTGGYAITLPQAVGDTLYLQVELAAGISYANGCVAGNVDVDGTTYWVAVQWEASGSGDIEMDMTNVFQVSLDGEAVTDEAIVAAATAGLLEQKNLTAQVWWANDAAGEGVDTSNAVITGAYVLADGSDSETDDVVYGDVNCDGTVNISDVLTLNKNLLGGETLTEAGRLNADVDLDGSPTAADAMNILKYTVKILTELPVK